MPRTPDSFPGVRIEEGLIISDDGYGLPQADGGIRFSDGYFYAKDAYGTFNIRHIASSVGQVLYSVDGTTFESKTPLTSRHGWLVNRDGILLVVG
jgi:hypothetical protein